MATIGEISAAINLIDVKKENLHKSFLHLQSQTPSSFNLPLNWADIDSYFTTLHSSLQSKFNLLQTVPPSSDTTTVPARPELKSFCENSDGLGLKRFIDLAPDQSSILSELPDAYRFAPDAPAMVLDAVVVAFYSPGGFEGAELRLFRNGCLVMLEGLLRVKPVVTDELKDKAMEMAVQWNQKRVSGIGLVKAKEQLALGFLLLVGAYGLVDRFSIDEIIDCFVVVATERNTVDLCRRIVPPRNIKDMIQKLIDKDMHVTAVNFSIGLQKTNEFSPVGLLEQRKLRSLRVIEEVRRNVKDLHVCNDVTMKEIDTLKPIIKCIEENNLQSEYPKDSVVELVNKLENEVESSKQALANDLCLKNQQSRAAVLNNHLRSRKQPARMVELVNKPENELANSKQALANDLCLSNQQSRAAVLNNHLRSRKQPARMAALKNPQQLRKQPARSAALKNQLRIRKQPARASVLKSQLRVDEPPARATVWKKQPRSKSTKQKLNKGQPAADSAAPATPIQNGKFVEEFLPQKSDLSPDHVGECHKSSLGSGPTGSNAPYVSPAASHDGSTRADIGYDFYVKQSQPPSDFNSNGWISD